MREFADSQPTGQMLSTTPCPKGLPPLLLPKGLDAKRKVYLYKEIRDFCKEEYKDTVCPDPGYVQQMDISPTATDSDSGNIPADSALAQEIPKSRRGRGRGRRATGRRHQSTRQPEHQASDSDDGDTLPTTSSAVQVQPDSDSDYEPSEQSGRRGRQRGRGRGRSRRSHRGRRCLDL